MNHFQLSKFSSQDENSWTAVSDIGNSYPGGILTQVQYLEMENLYIIAIQRILEAAQCGEFQIRMYEDNRGADNSERWFFNISDSLVKIRGGEYVSSNLLFTLCRLCLRELMWLRLESACGCYITFGHDYYIQFGIPMKYAELCKIIPKNIFIDQIDDDPHG